jgi:hypothetical protein
MNSVVRAITLLALIQLSAPLDLLQAQDADGGAVDIVLTAEPIPGALEIDLDGQVTEDAWFEAQPITDFTQQEPVEGSAPSYPTEVRVMFDADNLYIGAIIYDDPDGVLAYQRERDAGLGTDDRFMWILDTFRDGRTGYFFEINAAGLMGDGIITGGGGGGRGPGGGGGGGGGIEQGLGRHLGGAHGHAPRRLVRRDPDPVPHAELQPEPRHLGHQLPAHDPAAERGDPLAWLAARPGSLQPGLRGSARGAPGHVPGHRARGDPVGRHRLALGAGAR